MSKITIAEAAETGVLTDPLAESLAASSEGGVGLRHLPRGAIAWAVFQGFRDPFVILISIYIFGPYFATKVVGDPVEGQALIARIGTIYGLCAMVLAPLIGSSIDQFGRRKPMLLAITALLVPITAALWWAMPGGQGGLPVLAISFLYGAGCLMIAISEVLHNSLLNGAAGRRGAPAASGLALSMGNAVSVLMLVFVLWAFALPGQVDWGFIPAAPLFGLDPAQHEPDRIAGPLVALCMALGCIPFFLFTPDVPGTGVGLVEGVRRGVTGLVDTVRSLRQHRDAGLYLLTRMFYNDGMTALLLFGGVFAAGVMGWGVMEMLVYGIGLSVFAVAGGFLGAALDNRVGPRRAVMIEISGILVCLLAWLGISRDRIFYVIAYDPAAHAPVWNGPILRTAPELIFLAVGFGVAVFVTAAYASSRTLLARLAPPDKLASFFGLYGLSGTVTMWLGSLLVTTATSVFKTQAAGFAPIAGLLLVGLLGMFLVKGGDREA